MCVERTLNAFTKQIEITTIVKQFPCIDHSHFRLHCSATHNLLNKCDGTNNIAYSLTRISCRMVLDFESNSMDVCTLIVMFIYGADSHAQYAQFIQINSWHIDNQTKSNQ